MNTRIHRSIHAATPPFRLSRLALQIGLFGLAITATPLHAAEGASSQSATTLSTIKVKARDEESATGPVPGFIAKRSATGSKTDTPLTEIPQSISIIGRNELDNYGPLGGTAEALRYVPGVATETYGFDARGFDWFYLRGFDAYSTSDYRDGLNQVSVGPMNFRTEVFGLERIEVLRGPASVLFGQGDAGGLVNKVSKMPRADMTNQVGVAFGNYSRREGYVDVGGAADDSATFLYRIVGLILDTDTQDKYPTKHVSNERYYLAPSFTWRPTAATSLTILTELLKNNTDGFSVYATRPDYKPTRVLRGEPDWNKFDQDQSSIGYRFQQDFNENWSLRQNLRFAGLSVDYNHLRQWQGFADDDKILLKRGWSDEDHNLHQTTIDTQLIGNLQTGAVNHTLLFGVDWNRVNANLRRLWQNESDPDLNPKLNLLDPVYGAPVPPSDHFYVNFHERQELRQLGFYAQEQANFAEHWVLTAGGRYDKATTSQKGLEAGGKKSEQTDYAFSGRIGLNYVTSFGLAPYISYAESFLPVLDGISNSATQLTPTRGKQYEVGVKYQPEGQNILLTAALFDLRKKNVVTTDPNDPDYTRQSGEVRSRGLELEARANITANLNVHAAYTYNDVKVIKTLDPDEKDKHPVQVPKQIASLWADYTILDGVLRGLGFSGGVRYIDKTYNDAYNTSAVPSYTLVDAAVRYDTGPWRLAINATNLFDKDYVATCAYNSCYWGANRQVVGSVNYHW